MPDWKLKAAALKSASMLPGSWLWYRLLQTHVSRSTELTSGWFEDKLALCNKHNENWLSRSNIPNKSRRILELGTGWHPIVPVGLYLCGASSVTTVDKGPSLTNVAMIRQTLQFFVDYHKKGDLDRLLRLTDEARMSRLIRVLEDKRFSTPAEILERLDITLVVADASNTGLEGSSVDLFVSNNTLEHIPYPVLLNIFGEFRRLAAPKAIMSHYIDLNDHFALFDSSISPYHFLKFSTRTWRLIDNQFSPVNRLRISDYRTLHESAGFDILSEENDNKVNQFDRQLLAEEFRAYLVDDLIVTDSWMISTPIS